MQRIQNSQNNSENKQKERANTTRFQDLQTYSNQNSIVFT